VLKSCFTQSAGSNTIDFTVFVGGDPSSTGTYILTGGDLNVGGDSQQKRRSGF
jgi:hypothetical protein